MPGYHSVKEMGKFIGLVVIFIISACSRPPENVKKPMPSTNQAYRNAMEKATYPEPSKVCDSLFPINSSNKKLTWKTIKGEKYLLVVSLKGKVSFYKNDSTGFYNTQGWPIWVTASPQLLDRVNSLKPNDVDMRLKQLLGLPPESSYPYVVEFWVRPQDLFRPCPDNEIKDKTCDLCFPEKTDSSYIKWFNKTRIDRYYACGLENQYPWTQLGYTYDWNPSNRSHVGLSEYVIGMNKKIVVKKVYKVTEYLESMSN